MAVAQRSGQPTPKNTATQVRRWLLTVLPPLLVAFLLLALWQFEVIHRLLNIQTFQLPLPTQIIESAGRRSRDLWIGANYTLLEAVLGLAIGSAAGFLMALLFVWFDFARRGLMPIAITTNAIPIIAFVPIMSRWFGFDQPTRIAVVTMMTFAPMVVSAYKGLTSLDNNSADLMRSYAANPLQIFFKLRLPSSLPFVFSALKVGATASMIGSVVAEFFNSAGGIGKLIANNIQSGDFALAWCGVIIVTLMGLALYLLVSLAERVLVPWQNAFRAGNRN
jgi:NitT/TauT family transport system permease protein